jgi:plasmid stabilization system protein ParE
MTERRAPIIWSPEAADDVDHLWDYYFETIGRAGADKVLRHLGMVITTIDEFPLAGRPRDDIRLGLRSLSAGLQIVFYRLKKRSTGNRARALRTTRSRRDIL